MATAVPLDGRLARSARSRAAVVEALLDLLRAGELQPTAAQIAERAGVSLRLVFQHFEDLEALYAETADRQAAHIESLLAPIPAGAPLARRLSQFVAQRATLWESIAPIRRAALLRAPYSTVLAKRLAAMRRRMRAEVEAAFATELSALPAAARREVSVALAVSAGFSTWEALRRHHGLSVRQARSVVTRLLRSTLSA